jgi:hypothetical protein
MQSCVYGQLVWDEPASIDDFPALFDLFEMIAHHKMIVTILFF